VKPLIYVALFGPPLLSRVHICKATILRNKPFETSSWYWVQENKDANLAVCCCRLHTRVQPAGKVRHSIVRQLTDPCLASHRNLCCCSFQQQQGSQTDQDCHFALRGRREGAARKQGNTSCTSWNFNGLGLVSRIFPTTSHALG